MGVSKELSVTCWTASRILRRIQNMMQNTNGEDVCERQSVVNVSASLYSDLHHVRSCDTDASKWLQRGTSKSFAARISAAEVQRQIVVMKSGKAADSSSIVKEMLKISKKG